MAETNIETTPNSEQISNASTAVPSREQSPSRPEHGQKHHQKVQFSDITDEEEDQLRQSVAETSRHSGIPEIRLSESEDVADHNLINPGWTGITNAAAAQAQDRASRLHNRLNTSHARVRQHSGPDIFDNASLQTFASPNSSPPTRPLKDWPVKFDDIPLASLSKEKQPYAIDDDTTDVDSDVEDSKPLKRDSENIEEARRIVRTLTSGPAGAWQNQSRSGTQTPAADKRLHDLDYIPPPNYNHPSPYVLASKLTDLARNGITRRDYQEEPTSPPRHHHYAGGFLSINHSRQGSESHEFSTPSSGRTTPSKRPKWYNSADPEHESSGSINALLAQSAMASAAPAAPRTSNRLPRPAYHRAKSSQSQGMIAAAVEIIKHPTNFFQQKLATSVRVDEEQMVRDVAAILASRKYLKKLARCLMAVGAPTHRLEEYMKTSARALHIDGDVSSPFPERLCCLWHCHCYCSVNPRTC